MTSEGPESSRWWRRQQQKRRWMSCSKLVTWSRGEGFGSVSIYIAVSPARIAKEHWLTNSPNWNDTSPTHVKLNLKHPHRTEKDRIGHHPKPLSSCRRSPPSLPPPPPLPSLCSHRPSPSNLIAEITFFCAHACIPNSNVLAFPSPWTSSHSK